MLKIQIKYLVSFILNLNLIKDSISKFIHNTKNYIGLNLGKFFIKLIKWIVLKNRELKMAR